MKTTIDRIGNFVHLGVLASMVVFAVYAKTKELIEKANRKTASSNDEGFVYVMHDGSFTKIGLSREPEARLKDVAKVALRYTAGLYKAGCLICWRWNSKHLCTLTNPEKPAIMA